MEPHTTAMCGIAGGLGEPLREDGVWEGTSEMEVLVNKRRDH